MCVCVCVCEENRNKSNEMWIKNCKNKYYEDVFIYIQ